MQDGGCGSFVTSILERGRISALKCPGGGGGGEAGCGVPQVKV